jgi:hypothetical protein
LPQGPLCTIALSPESDVAGVPAECGDVPPDPAKRRLLIGETEVAGVRVAQGRVIEEAERTEPIIERHRHDVPLCDQAGRVIVGA